MTVTQRLRYEVLRRDNYTCRYCHHSDRSLTVDHVIPEALGGTNAPDNLVAACLDCNTGKASTAPDSPLVAGVTDDALRWAAAMREAADQQRQDRNARDAYAAQFVEAWHPRSLPPNWRNTIENWYSLDIEIDLLTYCVDVAFSARGIDGRWRYFCGVVWRQLRERQMIAHDLLANEEE